MMTHPMHVHGHTFALPNGLRKDTVLVPPMSQLQVDVQADNPGSWMTHCHNVYHAETGMMIEMKYRA
jgi:FtsP/CotA-like multicopper oxidase with cupredoxin domain